MFAVCTARLPNEREASIGGGDSGGPAFVSQYGELMLAANNTFSGTFDGQTPGTFGTFFGGMILGGYADYLQQAAAGDISFVPEPGAPKFGTCGSSWIFFPMPWPERFRG